MRILYLHTPERSYIPTYGVFARELRKLGEYDDVIAVPGMTEETRASLIRAYDVLLTMWYSPPVPDALAEDAGRLRLICNVTGELKRWISAEIVRHITVTNWGDAPAYGVAEGAMTLLLAMLKDIPRFINHVRADGEGMPEGTRLGSLYGMPVGVYGMGVIGARFAEMLKVFGAEVRAYDPYVKTFPEWVRRCATLDELFTGVKAVSVHAALCDGTRGSVDARRLAMLPNGGIVVNTARAGIIDEDALRAELVSGRLRAGLDVVGRDNFLPPRGDPLRGLPGAVLTAHHVGSSSWTDDPDTLQPMHVNCLENLRRLRDGEPLRFVIDEQRYTIMT